MSPAQPSHEPHPSLGPAPRLRPLVPLLLTVLAAAGLAAFPAPAARAQTLVVGSTSGPAGAEVSVPITLDGVGADHLQVDAAFDESVLTPVSVAAGPALDSHLLDWAVVAPGVLRVVVHSPACPDAAPAPLRRAVGAASLGDGVAALVSWEIDPAASPGTYPLPAENALLAAGAGTPVDAATTDGAVEVVAGDAVLAIPTLGQWGLAGLVLLLLGAGTWLLRRGARAGVAASLVVLLAAQPLLAQPLFAQEPPRPVAAETAGAASAAGAGPGARRAAAPAVTPGDADGDGSLTAADRDAVVGGILGRGTAAGHPDCDGSGAVDVLDVACVTDLLCAAGVNQPPTLAPIADASLREGEVYAAQPAASDPDPGDVLTFRLVAGPVGMVADPQTGSLLWVPRADQAGAATARLRVTDSGGLFAERDFSLDVRVLGGPPELAPIGDRTVTAGGSLSLTAAATDPDLPDDTLTFSLPLAPPGMSIDAAGGSIVWIPGGGDVGAHDVTVQVEDREGLIDFTSFVATVQAVNSPPSALDDTYVARVGEVLTVPAADGVLANDDDPDGDPLAASLVDPPAQGTLALAADGSLEYTPTVLGGSVEEDIDLTHLAVPRVEASSTFNASYVPERVSDGDLDTSWFTSGIDDDAWIDLVFLADVAVRRIELFGNREFGAGPHDFTSGVFDLYDAGSTLLFSSGELTLPAPDRDVVVDVEALAGGPVGEVRRVRFRATGYEGTLDHGLAELRVIGDGRRQRLEPTFEWAWTAASLGAGTPAHHGQVLMTPSVADLDLDGRPEVLFISEGLHRLYVADGADGSTLWTLDDVQHFSSSPVVGQLDGDPELEVAVVRDDQSTLTVLAHDGALEAEIDTGRTVAEANLALADLDGDGVPEIVVPGSNRVGAYHLDAGSLVELWISAADGCGNNAYRSNCIPVVSDVDLDGSPEILAGDVIYGADGSTERLGTGLGDGWNAVGNFDDDPYAEIVLVSLGRVWLLEHDLSVAWGPITHPGSGSGGAPTVADFDGDGRPEIGVAGATRYVVFDTDGSVLWEAGTQDNSSHRTGSTVFDFQNDGSAEVVYRDERHLWVYRGSDGAVLFQTPMRSSTTVEAPIVADVDADGAAEIVVSADLVATLPEGGNRLQGLYVFGGSVGDWVRARPIWNQHSYHVTNVLLDGTVPSAEQPNWLVPGLNDFRRNEFLPHEAGRADRFTYRAADDTVSSAPATVHVDLQPANVAPEIVSTPRRTATVGFLYLHQVRAADLDADPLSFALVDGPAGMTIDAVTGVLRWEPGSGDVGDHPVAVRVTDDDGFSGYQAFTLTVGEPVEVPELGGLDRGSAEAALGAVLLVPGRVSEATHPTVPAGLVTGQTPPAGSVAELGSAVSFGLSLGPAPEDVDDDGDGFTENEGDCDDGDGGVHPGATDVPDDGVDQDCDGADAPRPIVELVIEPATATLVAGEAIDLAAWGVRADGTAQIFDALVTWSATGGVSVDARGVAVATAAGPATVTATYGAHAGSAAITVVAHDPADDDAPTVEVLAPADGETVLGPVDVIGTVDDPQLVRYELAVSPAGEESFTTIGGGTAPVAGGVLGTLDPTLMPNGLFTLRLTAVDAGGNAIADESMVQVDGGYKAGRFTIGFVDLEVQLGGLPIQIERVYDSLLRFESGDFGFGWNYRIRSFEITCTDPIGESWRVLRSGLSYVLGPERARRCSVRMPSGALEEFALAPRPASSAVVPFSFLVAGFQPLPGTHGTLRSLDNPNLLIADPQPGAVTLLDDATLRTFAPERFLYTTREGLEVTLSTTGGLERVRDRNGNTLTFGPGGVEHSSGTGVTFQRDGAGRIVSITGPDGVPQTYAYGPSGDLLSHTDREGLTTRFRHDRRHLLLDFDDPLGRKPLRNEYDDSGRLIATTDAEGNRIELDRDLGARREIVRDFNGQTIVEYDPSGRIIARTNPLGERWELEYDSFGNVVVQRDPLGRERTRVSDDRGLVLEETDYEGNTRLREYNALGLVVREVDPEGNATEQSWDARGNLTSRRTTDGFEIRFAYDGRGNRTAKIDHEGRTTRFAYDAQGRMVEEVDPTGVARTFTYDADGRRLTESQPRTLPDGSRELVTYRYEYDANGQQIGVIDPLGRRTSTPFDANGKEERRIDPLGHAMIYDYDDRDLVTEIEFSDGSKETLAYDAVGRLTGRTDRDGRIRQFGYDALDRQIAIIEPGGATHGRTYDEAGRTASITDPGGHTTLYQYGTNLQRVEDPLGFVTEHLFDSSDAPVRRIDAAGSSTVFVRDADGRLVRTEFADATSETIVRSSTGKPLETIDQLGHRTRFEYDGQDRLIAVTDPAGAITSYAYDELDNLIVVTDALGRTTRIDRDALGRMVRRILPLGQVESFEYDALDNLIRHVDYNGDATTFEYDGDGDLVRKSFADGSELRYEYSDAGLRNRAGGAITTYDAAGRVASVTDATGQQLAYAYDAGGNVTSITSPHGVTTMAYDPLNRLSQVADSTGATSYGYDAVGNLARMEYPNGVVTELDFDDLHRLIEMRVSGSSGLLARYRYDLDAAGRRVRVEETGPATEERVVTYQYDAAGRLVAETIDGPGAALDQTREYQLDAVGNRLQMTVQSAEGRLTVDYQYDDNDRLVRKTSSFESAAPLAAAASGNLLAETLLFYDENGALVRREQGGVADVFSWNHAGRLVAADLRIGRPSPTSLSFEYDADGNRTAATADGVTTRYLVDTNRDLPVVLAESTGAQVTTFSHGHDPIAQTRGGSTRWYLFDGSMSVRHLIDGDGAFTDSYSYDAFGVDLGSDGATPNPFRYRGEQLDESLGMYYLRARYYDQDDGVFLAQDPAPGSPSDPRTFHRYLYAGADPVTNVDPTGMAYSVAEIAVITTLAVVIGFGFTYAATEDAAYSLAVGVGAGLLVLGLVTGIQFIAARAVTSAASASGHAFKLVTRLVTSIDLGVEAGWKATQIASRVQYALIASIQKFGVRGACRVLRHMAPYVVVGAGTASVAIGGGQTTQHLISPYYQAIIGSAVSGALFAMGC
jgi:RHS repeat-associated protein